MSNRKLISAYCLLLDLTNGIHVIRELIPNFTERFIKLLFVFQKSTAEKVDEFKYLITMPLNISFRRIIMNWRFQQISTAYLNRVVVPFRRKIREVTTQIGNFVDFLFLLAQKFATKMIPRKAHLWIVKP